MLKPELTVPLRQAGVFDQLQGSREVAFAYFVSPKAWEPPCLSP